MSDKFDHQPLVAKVLTGLRWALFLRLSAQIVAWSITIFVVRFVAPADYGLQAMLEVPMELLLLGSTLGLDMALIQADKTHDDHLRSVFGLLLLVNGALFLVFFGGAPLFAAYYHEPRLTLIAQVMSFVFLLVPFRVIPNALLDRKLDFKLRAQLEISATVVAAVVTLILAIAGFGVWALVFGMLANVVLVALLLLIVAPWFVVPSFNFSGVGHLIRFGGAMMLTTALTVLGGRVVILIAGPTLGPELLGFYVVAMQFALLPLAKLMPILQQVMFPAFSRLRAQRELAVKYFNKTVGLVACAVFPALIGLASVSNEFVQVVFGSKWLPIAWPLAVLAALMPVRMITNLSISFANGMGRPDVGMHTGIVMLSMLSVGAYAALNWGVMGLVAVWAVVIPVVALLTTWRLHEALGLSPKSLVLSVMPATFASAVMGGSVYVVKFALAGISTHWLLPIECVVGAMIYYLVMRVRYPDLLIEAKALVLKK